jgi:hypothetical protein
MIPSAFGAVSSAGPHATRLNISTRHSSKAKLLLPILLPPTAA